MPMPASPEAPPRFPAAATLLVLLLLAPADGIRAQTMADLFRAVERGGGWVSIPVREGRASLETVALPTGGATLAGCLHVWKGHTGTWEIEAQDLLGDGRLAAVVGPGESEPFRYASGARAKLKVDVRWSEPRDTTLHLWVGLEGLAKRERDVCRPPG